MLKFECYAVVILLFSYSTRLEAASTFAKDIEVDAYDWSQHPCNRECTDGEEPQECHYSFVVEMYSTMSKACFNCPFNVADCYRPHCVPADGAKKSIFVVNRQLPGPAVQVCKNDTIIVDMRNSLLAESTAIHWHGIHQTGTPYMDGVPYATQCPVLPRASFRYTFKASTSGTHFWHSHMGFQRNDGLFGALIVKPQPKDDPHKKLYDHDNHIMLINDWSDLETNAGFLGDIHAGMPSRSDTILINGLGRLHKIVDNGTTQYTPTTVFKVKKDSKYRFRLIDAGSNDCPIRITIDNHAMTVISMDGNDIEPVDVDAIHIWTGERIDFVIKSDKEVDNYWIRYRGFGACDNAKDPEKRVHQVAILRYESAETTDPKAPVGYDILQLPANARSFNPQNERTKDKSPNTINLPALRSIAGNDESSTIQPDQQLYISFDYYKNDNQDFHRRGIYGYNEVPEKFKRMSLQLNRIRFQFPIFPPLSQPELVKDNTFCNSTTLADRDCVNNECACTHVLQVKLNSVIELVIVDEGVGSEGLNTASHPFHLHGTNFRVIAMGELTEPVTFDLFKKLDSEGKIKRNLDRAPLKDTVKVPVKGYTIVRFHATNPGYWLFHCHIDSHMVIGMALMIKVGEHTDFPPRPKNLPTCGELNPT